MRVLCAQRDVIGKIGGGESASTRLFQGQTRAHYTWPVSQPPTGDLPANFEHVMIDSAFRSSIQTQLRSLERVLSARDRDDFYEAVSVAHAVRGREFDVVECPDYLPYGRFLPFALDGYGVKYKRLVCSLHGLMSRTFEVENEFNEIISGPKLDELKRAERQFVFGAADIRYGFSERYVKQATQGESQSAAVVDPLCALPPIPKHLPSAANGRRESSVWFVGRHERIKGGDLFLRAIFRAGPELWQRYAMCGPAVRLGNRPSVIEGMSFCTNRGMPFNYRGALPYHEVVREVFQAGALVVIPSRADTFNLVALEALLNGVPVLISKHAGASDFIRTRFGPDFSGAMEFDPLDEIASAFAIRTMSNQLEDRQRTLTRALGEIDFTPQPDRLLDAYGSEPEFSAQLRNEAFSAWDRVLKHLFLVQPVCDSGQTAPGAVPPKALTGRALFKMTDAILEQLPVENPLATSHQVRRLAALSPHANRARIYRYAAECEEKARPVVAAAYRLRAFRMAALSCDDVTELTQQLGNLGFPQEEESLQMWSDENSVTAHLEQRRQRLMEVELDAPEYVVDRRDASTPQVSIIVSMYNAPKTVLEHFITQLNEVAMVRERRAEVVFVDSGSAAHHRELLESIPGSCRISHVLVRSVNRETIQTAWNRGIRMARAEYITCLGVDEGVTEFALDELAQFLDNQPEVDWVTANTVATQVDAQGHWKRDVISYARPTYSRFNYLNDCTYINYVGGLYRRSIHTRFGWYDGSFKGAGDTEFKCRIFPFIRTAALPKTLGFYFDFPAPRVTNSANIEVEDLRAWYVFRTRGGIEYLMQEQNTAAWEELFWTALSGRRCWSKVPLDCDLSFAANVLHGLLQREPAHHLRALDGNLRTLIREMRLLQNWPANRAWLGAIAELDLVERSRNFFRKCSKKRPDLNFPSDFRSDAFFFAHNWMW